MLFAFIAVSSSLGALAAPVRDVGRVHVGRIGASDGSLFSPRHQCLAARSNQHSSTHQSFLKPVDLACRTMALKRRSRA